MSIKAFGLACIPFDIPAAWRARVIADLERFVLPTQFPKHIALWEANNLVSARVEEVLAPYREEQARQRAQKVTDEQTRWQLIALKIHGVNYASKETGDWDWSAQSDARREAARELDAKVQAGWSVRDVEKLVDHVLDDWVADDEEDGDDGGEADQDDEADCEDH
ncbi:MAG: hypothetical protein ACKVZ0_00255 [Gemmatimonadales bacterium]